MRKGHDHLQAPQTENNLKIRIQISLTIQIHHANFEYGLEQDAMPYSLKKMDSKTEIIIW